MGKKKEHPWIGIPIILKPHHFQIEDEDWKGEDSMGISKRDFYGKCKIESIGCWQEGPGCPADGDYVFFTKVVKGKKIIFPDAPINFYDIPKELEDIDLTSYWANRYTFHPLTKDQYNLLGRMFDLGRSVAIKENKKEKILNEIEAILMKPIIKKQ